MKTLSQTAAITIFFSTLFLHTSADIAHAFPPTIEIGTSCGGVTKDFCDTPFILPSGQDPVKVS